jgi:iron-sulfur cluster assembly accessory protein
MNLTITPKAEKFIKRMTRFGGGPNSGFRLWVTPGGCSGLAAEFDIEPAPREGDAVLEQQGMRLFLPGETRRLLDGVTVDFAETSTQSGLIFHDPKANGSNCSSSNSVVSLDSLFRPR